jgi:succinyl-diaminopimelate desuccinylase
VIPGTVVIDFNFRFSPESTVDGLKTRVHALLDAHGLEFDLTWSLSGMPFLTPRGTLCNALREAVKEVTGVTTELSTTGGTSDGRFIAAIAREVAELGPVNASIHKLNEHVALDAVDPLKDIYKSTLKRLLLIA